MKHKKTFAYFNLTTTVKFISNFAVLLTVLFAAAAHARNDCPPADSIGNNFTKDNNFIKQSPGTEWELDWNKPWSDYQGKTLELYSIRGELIPNPTKGYSSTKLQRVECVYNYKKDNPAENLVLSIKMKAQLDYQNYYLYSGNLRVAAKWNRKEPGYAMCTGPFPGATRDDPPCGGFKFMDTPQEAAQFNGYWENAQYFCSSFYSRCENFKWHMHYLSNTFREPTWVQVGVRWGMVNPSGDCSTLDCKSEIERMNIIVGGGTDPIDGNIIDGLAKYGNKVCWINNPHWKTNNWPNPLPAGVDICNGKTADSWPNIEATKP